MAIPAYLMDQPLAKRIKHLEEKMEDVFDWINNLEIQNKKLKQEIEKDVHEHVKKLVDQIHTLENEIKALKQ
ncbi:MAG: hypothetical protein JSW00_03950 [Thermoplasmata archaeon]|nr:MAG: hypothetical protein JSW00_03950 [Thermoplasmata archaeon]